MATSITKTFWVERLPKGATVGYPIGGSNSCPITESDLRAVSSRKECLGTGKGSDGFILIVLVLRVLVFHAFP